MKQLILLSLVLLSLHVLSQEKESVTLNKEYSDATVFPHIEGYYTGEIPVQKIASLNGIQTQSSWKVVSFQLNYSKGSEFLTVPVRSNLVPDSLVLDLVSNSLYEQVYFTEIYARDPSGILHLLTPMVLIPVDENEK